MSQKSLSLTLRFILGVAGLGIALIAVRQASGLIVPLLLSWIIVLSASPLFYWLRKKNAPGWTAFKGWFWDPMRSFPSAIQSTGQNGPVCNMYCSRAAQTGTMS